MKYPTYRIRKLVDVYTKYYDYKPHELNHVCTMDTYVHAKKDKSFMVPKSDSALLSPDVENIIKMTGENENIFDTVYDVINN